MKKETKLTKSEETAQKTIQDKPKRKYNRKPKNDVSQAPDSSETLINKESEVNEATNIIDSVETTLLSSDDYMTDDIPSDDQAASLVSGFATAIDSDESKVEQQRLIDEHNRRVMQSPEFQAQVMYDNYLRTTPGMFDGKTKRRLRKQFLHEAKKGKFKRFFDEEMIAKRQQREQEKFDRLNAPVIHSVDDIPADMQETLKMMADMEVPKK